MSAKRTVVLFFSALLVASTLVAGCHRQLKALPIGAQAPSFTTTDYRGRPVSLDAWRGRPVIIRFFSPECKFCMADSKIFNDFYHRLHSKGLEILWVNTMPNSKSMKTFAADMGVKFPIVTDNGGKLSDLYRVKVVPQVFILSPKHRIAGVMIGGAGSEEFSKVLRKYFKQS